MSRVAGGGRGMSEVYVYVCENELVTLSATADNWRYCFLSVYKLQSGASAAGRNVLYEMCSLRSLLVRNVVRFNYRSGGSMTFKWNKGASSRCL